MAVVLGRNCSISGFSNNAVRSVTWSSSAKELEYQPFGTRYSYRHNYGYDATVEIELVEDDGSAVVALQNGGTLSISGSGYSGSWVITNVVRSEPLDDVVTVRVTAKLASGT